MPRRDAQNVCAVTKGGTVLHRGSVSVFFLREQMEKGMGGVRKVGEEGAGQAGFQRWQEAERVGEIYATLHNISR